MLNDAVIAWIRTTVPVIIGSAVAWLASVGIVLGDDASQGAIIAVTGVTVAVYYTVASAASRKWPWLGWLLLGHARTPTYQP